MKLEQQVVSLELAKKLKELGVKQESVFFWVVTHDGWEVLNHTLMRHPGSLGTLYTVQVPDTGSTYSAFTVAELGEMLPFSIKFQKHICYLTCEKNIPDYGGWVCRYESSDIIRPTKATDIFTADTEADARAKMLAYLIENDLLNK